jgi:hypothetical protein
MKEYTLVWSVSDHNGYLLEGGIHDLPVIHPGDESLFRNISWEAPDSRQLRVDLLDPQQYSVRDTTIHFSPPDTPEIVPTGARISAGKSGNVLKSCPSRAVFWENWKPVNWMPSPESPAKSMVALSRSLGVWVLI